MSHLHNYAIRNIPNQCFPDFLFHYTKPGILPFICNKRGRLLATQINYLADKQEITLGIDLISQYLIDKEGWPQEHVMRIKDIAIRVIREASPHMNGVPVAPWVTSLSCRLDSPRMWHDYTLPQGGYCLAFRHEGLRSCVEQLMNGCSNGWSNKNDIIYILPCFYVGKHDIYGFISSYIADFKDLFIKEAAESTIVAHMIVMATLIKGSSYQYEHEWRIVLLPSFHRFHDVEWIGEPNNATARLSIGLENCLDDFRRLIGGILVSPQGNHQELKAKAKKLSAPFTIHNKDVQARIKIKVSGLPTSYDSLATYYVASQVQYECHT